MLDGFFRSLLSPAHTALKGGSTWCVTAETPSLQFVGDRRQLSGVRRPHRNWPRARHHWGRRWGWAHS